MALSRLLKILRARPLRWRVTVALATSTLCGCSISPEAAFSERFSSGSMRYAETSYQKERLETTHYAEPLDFLEMSQLHDVLAGLSWQRKHPKVFPSSRIRVFLQTEAARKSILTVHGHPPTMTLGLNSADTVFIAELS